MPSSGMLPRVALVRTDVSEELSTSFIRVTRIGELGTTPAITSLVFLCSIRRLLVTAGVVPSSPNLVTLMKEALSSFETSVLTRATRRNIPEDSILHCHRRGNLKSHMLITHLFQLPPGDMGNKQAPQSQSGDEEDRVPATTVAASTASVPGTPRATTSGYPPQENGEEGEEELPPLPPPMKPITEPILVASGSASSCAEESQGKRVCLRLSSHWFISTEKIW
jgi:hypothetical protein